MRAVERAVRELVARHFAVDPDLREVYAIISTKRSEPVRLLEVNTATVPTGRIEPFVFRPTAEFPYWTALAEITPDELEHFKRRRKAWPEGWNLADAVHIAREAA